MDVTINAVYENGTVRFTGPVPFADGSTVQVTGTPVAVAPPNTEVTPAAGPTEPAPPPPPALDPDSPGQKIYRRLLEILAKHPGKGVVSDECVSRDHDKILYDELQR